MKRGELWLFSKHGNDIGDNAYSFFKYVRREHPEIRCIFVADKKSIKEFKEAKTIGEVVQYKSLRHKYYFLRADKIITSHVGDSEPWDYEKIIELRQKHPKWAAKHKIIHLQHGVIDKNVAHIYDKSLRPVDLFICSTEAEAKYVKKTLHYADEQIALTGLARWDELNDSEPQKVILLIPRYRRDVMVQLPENKVKLKYHFMQTMFYKRYQAFLDNKELHKLLNDYGYELIFYPHYEVQPLMGCFHTKCKNIVFATHESDRLDFLLKQSALMITDYSSVAFDFAYMRKPVIYYQFDKGEYESEYGGSYFDYDRDGFGNVVLDEKSLIAYIKSYLSNQGDKTNDYFSRGGKAYINHDKNNCLRIYQAIDSIK